MCQIANSHTFLDPIPRPNTPASVMPQSSIERLPPSISCIIRSARALPQRRREAIADYSPVNDTRWHLIIICSSLLRLAMSQFTSPCLRARKVYTAVPAKRAEILRERKIILADSQYRIYCCYCAQSLLKELYVCSICQSFVCGS